MYTQSGPAVCCVCETVPDCVCVCVCVVHLGITVIGDLGKRCIEAKNKGIRIGEAVPSSVFAAVLLCDLHVLVTLSMFTMRASVTLFFSSFSACIVSQRLVDRWMSGARQKYNGEYS